MHSSLKMSADDDWNYIQTPNGIYFSCNCYGFIKCTSTVLNDMYIMHHYHNEMYCHYKVFIHEQEFLSMDVRYTLVTSPTNAYFGNVPWGRGL